MIHLSVPDNIYWQILVVDNGSTDDTGDVVAKFTDSLPVRRIVESRQGLSRARNLALDESTSDLILWTDDDVLVDPDWIVAYLEASDAFPEAMFFGGTVDPWFESRPRRWIAENLVELGAAYAIRQLGAEIRPLGPGEMPFGANMAVRREAVGETRFNPALGRSGSNLLSGEETDFLGRIQTRSAKPGLWVGTARVRHFIPKTRTTKRYLASFFRGLGESARRAEGVSPGLCFQQVPLWLWREYLKATALYALLNVVRNRVWVQAFRRRAYLQGYISACQELDHIE